MVNLTGFLLLLLMIYVDDGNMAARALPLGSRLIDGKIEIVESEIEKDREIPADIRTSNISLNQSQQHQHKIISDYQGSRKLQTDS